MLRLLLILCVLHLSLPVNVQPAIVFDRTEVDLGFIYRDEPQKIVFTFKNASEDTLRIFEVEPSCDCTTGQALPDVIGPQGEGKILVFFDPMGFEGRDRIEEFVRVTTTDPSRPEILLTFSMQVGIGPELEPRTLNFGKLPRGESDTLWFSIQPAPGKILDVLEVYSDTACVVVQEVGTDTSGAHEFMVVATNEGGWGRLASFVTVVTSDSLRSQIRVPVNISLVGNIIAEPDIIVFGAALPGSYIAPTVRIFSKDRRGFNLAKIASSVEHLVAELTPVSESSYQLRLRVKQDAPPGRIAGEIKLESDRPDEPPLEIKVTGYIRSSDR